VQPNQEYGSIGAIDLACKKDFYLTPAEIVLERSKLGAFL
jgi:hypothetical protein